jgi:hypothetical protein
MEAVKPPLKTANGNFGYVGARGRIKNATGAVFYEEQFL